MLYQALSKQFHTASLHLVNAPGNSYPLEAEDSCAWQLQEAQEGAVNDMREQLQQLSGRAKALCQALRGAVDLLLDCIRASQRAASSLSGVSQGGAAGGEEQLLLCPANAEAIAAMVDLSVSEASLPGTNCSCRCYRITLHLDV